MVQVEWDVVVVVHLPWDMVVVVLVVEVGGIAMDHRVPMEEEEAPHNTVEVVTEEEEQVLVPMGVVEVEGETGAPIEVVVVAVAEEEEEEAVVVVVMMIQDANDIVRVVEVRSGVTLHVRGIKMTLNRFGSD